MDSRYLMINYCIIQAMDCNHGVHVYMYACTLIVKVGKEGKELMRFQSQPWYGLYIHTFSH